MLYRNSLKHKFTLRLSATEWTFSLPSKIFSASDQCSSVLQPSCCLKWLLHRHSYPLYDFQVSWVLLSLSQIKSFNVIFNYTNFIDANLHKFNSIALPPVSNQAIPQVFHRLHFPLLCFSLLLLAFHQFSLQSDLFPLVRHFIYPVTKHCDSLQFVLNDYSAAQSE